MALKKKLFLLVLIITVLGMISCSSDSDSTGPEKDTEAPEVVFVGLGEGQGFTGIFNLEVNAIDNQEVENVVLFIDGLYYSMNANAYVAQQSEILTVLEILQRQLD